MLQPAPIRLAQTSDRAHYCRLFAAEGDGLTHECDAKLRQLAGYMAGTTTPIPAGKLPKSDKIPAGYTYFGQLSITISHTMCGWSAAAATGGNFCCLLVSALGPSLKKIVSARLFSFNSC